MGTIKAKYLLAFEEADRNGTLDKLYPNRLIKKDGVNTINGYPVDDVIVWGMLLKESGMTIEELRSKTDLVRLGFELSQELNKRALEEMAKRTIK